MVYIREAHPVDEWIDPLNAEEGVAYDQPTNLDDRRKVARTCRHDLGLSIPVVVDDPDDSVEKLYAGWPERMFVVGTDGLIKYAGKHGPWGFKPRHVERWLRRYATRAKRGAE